MAKDGLPEILFVGRKRKERYKLTVFIIDEMDEKGIPRKLRLLLDHEKVEIKEGMAFMTGYVPEHMLEKE